jgi:hypothetical protein
MPCFGIKNAIQTRCSEVLRFRIMPGEISAPLTAAAHDGGALLECADG